MNKYRNIKTVIDNIKFDSLKESFRYKELKLMLKAKVITNLMLQPRFVLQLGFTDNKGVKHRAIEYVADFLYKEDGKVVVEDTKGYSTEVYKLKKKLFLFANQHIDFREL